MLDERSDQPSLELAVWLALRDWEEFYVRPPSETRDDGRRRVRSPNAQSKIDERLECLRERLKLALPEPRALPGCSWAERVFAAILMQFDERELDQGRAAFCADAVLLQTRYANTRDGGEAFYEYLEIALRSRTTPQLVLQLFLYCMKSGFCGRYQELEDPERLSILRELIDRVSPSRATTVQTAPVVAPVALIAGRPFPYWNYVIASFVLLVLWSSLHVAASLYEVQLVGMTHCEDP